MDKYHIYKIYIIYIVCMCCRDNKEYSSSEFSIIQWKMHVRKSLCLLNNSNDVLYTANALNN